MEETWPTRKNQPVSGEESVSRFEGFGSSGGNRIVEAKFGLRHFNLADEDSAMAATDARIIENMKERWKLLR